MRDSCPPDWGFGCFYPYEKNGTVGPRVGIFLSLLNTNDGFYLSHIPHTNPWGNRMIRRMIGRQVMSLYIKVTSSCYVTSQHIQEHLETLF